MIVASYIAAIAVTLTAVVYFAATDPKRRRVSGLPPFTGQRRTVLALFAALVPAAVLIAVGDGAGLVVWLGATTIMGWGVAALPPRQSKRIGIWITRALGKVARGGPAALRLGRQIVSGTNQILTAPGRLGDLQTRVVVLEKAIADLQAEMVSRTAPEKAASAQKLTTALPTGSKPRITH